MSSVEIKVGQKWKTRGGDVVEIVEDAQDYQPFKGSNGYWYFKSGVAYKEYPSEEDLVKLLTEEYAAESLRNSILEVRSKREELQKEILQLDEQEKEAVEKLKEQGFVLYEENVAQPLVGQALVTTENKAVLYAEDIEEDVTNPENWEVGDFVEAVENSIDSAYIKGKVYEIDDLRWYAYNDCTVYTKVDSKGSKTNGWSSDNLKFHSRPVK